MPMSKKHYEAVAKVLCDSYKQVTQKESYEIVDATVGELVQIFKNDNPRFDKERFLEAIDRCARRG